MKNLIVLLSVLSAFGCTSKTVQNMDSRQPNQVTGDVGFKTNQFTETITPLKSERLIYGKSYNEYIVEAQKSMNLNKDEVAVFIKVGYEILLSEAPVVSYVLPDSTTKAENPTNLNLKQGTFNVIKIKRDFLDNKGLMTIISSNHFRYPNDYLNKMTTDSLVTAAKNNYLGRAHDSVFLVSMYDSNGQKITPVEFTQSNIRTENLMNENVLGWIVKSYCFGSRCSKN